MADSTQNARDFFSGFTLVEVLCAMLITSILVLGISSAYRQAHQLWSRIEDQRYLHHVSGNVIESLRTDSAGLYLPPVEEGNESFILSTEANGSTDLKFYSLSPSYRTGTTGVTSAVVQYRFSRNEETGESILERLETPCAGEVIVGEPVSDIVAQGEFDLHVWALDPGADGSGRSFKTSYTSHEHPPKALKMIMECSGKDTRVAFEALIEIPCDSVLQEEEASE